MKKLLLLLFIFAGLNVFGQENFDGLTVPAIPAGWAQFETGTGAIPGQSWLTTNAPTFTYGGTGNSAMLNRENVPAGQAIDWLVTNQITIPANGQLRFQTKTIQAGVQGSLFDIKISTTTQTNPAAFTNLISYDEASLTVTNNVFEEKIIDLSVYPAGTQVYIAFVMTNDNGDRWVIDNVNIVQKCNTPIGPLSTSGETTSSALLSWGSPGGVSQWEVQVVEFALPFTDPSVLTLTANTNVNFLFGGLTANKLYKFRVRSVCTSALGDYESDWFGPISFQTASFGDSCSGPIVVGNFVGTPPTQVFVPGLLPYQTVDNTGNYLDTNDIAQPLACSGSATNYMQGNDVFYSFTPSATGNFNFNLAPTNIGSSIHVYSACPNAPGVTCMGGVANNNANPRNFTLNGLVGGTTYYVIVSSSGGASQTVGYTLTIQQVFCNQPTGLTATNITSTSAELGWAPNAGTTAWQYSFAPAPYALPTGTSIINNTTSNTANIANGIPGVVYQYYVRADCNDGNHSIWSGPFTYTLPQVATPLNFTDGLETLTGWTLNNNGTQPNVWAVGTGTNNGGTHALYITDSYGTTNTYNNGVVSTSHAYKDFIIPAGATQLDLTFDWRSVGELTNDYLRVWTVPTATVITPGTLITNAANRINISNDLNLNPNFTTQNYTVNATPYAGGTMRLVFEWRNNNAAGNQTPAAIDNIKLDLITCPKPGNLVVSNIIYNAAQLTWANGGSESQWEVLVLPAGATPPTAASVGTITNSGSPFQITGLTSVTCYDVYVRARCSATQFSFWSVKTSFCTTPNYCAGDHFYDDGGLAGNYANSQSITSTACPTNAGDIVTVVFNSFNVASGDTLVIRDGNLPTSPVVGTYTGTTLPPSFSATSASGCLTFVFTSNASGVAPGWDATIYCTPPITCPKPSSVIVSNITASSVDLAWTESGTATGWQVLVLPAGSNVPVFTATGNSFSATTITFPGLLPATAYTVYVRAICSSSNKSFWTDGINFSTPPVNDNCINAIQAFVNTDLACVNTNPVDMKGATPSITTGTCNANANDVWYKFTATSTTHTIQTEGTAAVMGTVNLALYSGTCASLNLIQCGTTTTVAGPTVVGNAIEGHVANGLTIGQTYYIRLVTTSATNSSIPFKLCIGSISCEGADPLCAGVTYSNSVDVINFGNYQCLGTSPNVKFFFIQAGVTGTYTCQISQTSGDVDYALWGPYATKQIGCNDVPNQTPIRCSFSAAAVENFTLPVIAGQFYILMVTNYENDPGTISIVTNQPIPTCYNADFHYSSPTYCMNESPASPIFVSGGSAGVFTASPAGLSITSSTGVIDFATSLPGNYIVTNTVTPNNLPPYSNDPITHSVLVTVTQPSNATITYANNAVFCNSDATTYPVIITGNSGPNPYYSATPAGLQYALDPISGNITPSLAQPGIYTVTMTIPANGGCALYTTTKTVEILVSPVIAYNQDVNACNSYVLPALTIGNYFTTTGGVGPLNAGDVITTNQAIYVYATNGTCSSEDVFNVNIINIPTPTFDYLTQPTCAIQTGSINITAPVVVGGTAPSNLFISEVTDANTGALSYVELFNATGATVNLANYRLKMYNNGIVTPTWQQTLSGTVANNSAFVIKISNDPSIPGVTHNLVIPNSGVDNNDNIRLTTLTNVEIDMWGPTNGTVFTPSNQPGYTYRRLASATPIPSTTWNPSDWNALDPENYSNLGQYTLNASSYEYSVDSGAYQTNTTFTGLTPGNHTFIVHDLINNCYSAPISFTINAVPYTTAVTDFTYTTPVCITSSPNPTPALGAGFTSGGTFSYVGTGLDLNSANGTITLASSTAGTYTVTYTYPEDLANCIHTNFSSSTIVIDPYVTATFTQIASICQNTTAPVLPLSSNNTDPITGNPTPITGSWSPSVINTSTAGTTTYTFTPNPGQCGFGTTMNITIDPIIVPTFGPIASICQNDSAPSLLTTSTNGITGLWNPSVINTAIAGVSTYTFTPSAGQCSQAISISVTIISSATPTFTPVETLCVGDANVTLPTTSNNSIHGGWSPAVVDTSVDGTFVYTFTPDVSECASATTMTVTVELCEIQKGISPNGDGKNEYLKLKANKVEIFNRYGKEVYSKTNYNNDWHGQFMGGGEMPDGTYYYVIELVSGDIRTGWIYINR